MIDVENANNNNAIATNLPPYWPSIPCENAFAVNTAELTSDLPFIVTCSDIFPFLTSSFPENKPSSIELEILISSAIDLDQLQKI